MSDPIVHSIANTWRRSSYVPKYESQRFGSDVPQEVQEAINTNASRRSTEQKRLLACRFHMNGNCRNGDACEYCHEDEAIAAFKKRRKERNSSSSSERHEAVEEDDSSQESRKSKKAKAYGGGYIAKAAASVIGLNAEVAESAPVPKSPPTSRGWGSSLWKAAKTAAVSVMAAPAQVPKVTRQVAWAPTLESVENFPLIEGERTNWRNELVLDDPGCVTNGMLSKNMSDRQWKKHKKWLEEMAEIRARKKTSGVACAPTLESVRTIPMIEGERTNWRKEFVPDDPAAITNGMREENMTARQFEKHRKWL